MSKLDAFLKWIPAFGRRWSRDEIKKKGFEYSERGFLESVKDNDLEVAQYFLKAEIDINASGEKGNTALIEASQRGHSEIVALLLERPEIEINAVNEAQDSALHVACRESRDSVLEQLIKHRNLKVNIRNAKGETALAESCKKGLEKSVSILLSHSRIKVNEKDDRGDTPLILAVRSGKPGIVALLLNHREIDINQRNHREIDALYEACVRGYQDIQIMLIAHGADRAWTARKRLEDLGVTFDKENFLDTVKQWNEPVVDLFLDGKIDSDVRDQDGNTPIILATEKGWTYLAKRLIDEHADIHARNKFGTSALMVATYNKQEEIAALLKQEKADERGLVEVDLMMAIEAEDIDGVKNVLAKKPNVNDRAVGTKTPLMRAVLIKNQEAAVLITTELLKNGAQVDRQDEEGKSALMYAAENNQTALIYLLISHGANLEQTTQEEHKTSLILAAERGNTDAVKCLLSKGAKDSTKDTTGKTARIAALLGRHLNTAKVLPPNREDDAWTNLMRSAYTGDITLFKKAWNVVKMPNITDELGNTPLMIACKRDSREIVQELLAYGADLDVRNINNETGLILAARAGHTEILTEMLEKGASFEIQNKAGNTALIEAAAHGKAQAVRVLLEKGADPVIPAANGTTALVEACHHGFLVTVEVLLDHQKSKNLAALVEFVNQQVPLGFTARMTAELAGHIQVCDLLAACSGDKGVREARLFRAARSGERNQINDLENNASKIDESIFLDAQNREGFTALMEATQAGHIEAIKLLLELGADAILSAKSTTSALSLAAANGRIDILEILLPKVRVKMGKRGTQVIDALVVASRKGHTHVVEFLLNEVPDAVDGNKSRGIPLVIAATNGYVDIVRILIGRGARVDQVDAQGQTALGCAILNEYNNIAQLLIQNGAKEETASEARLIVQSRAGNEEEVENLLKNGANINACDREGRSVLMWACIKRHKKVVEVLAKYDALDLPHQSKSGHRTALLEACNKGSTTIVEILLHTLDKKEPHTWAAVVDAVDRNGFTPLKEALLRGQKEIQTLLEKYKAQEGRDDAMVLQAADRCRLEILRKYIGKTLNVNVRDRSNRTPLMLAAQNGWLEGVRVLLGDGADLDLVNKSGETALLLAVKNGHSQVAKFLIESRADLDIASQKGATVLIEAANRGMDSIIQHLIEREAALDVKNARGESALILAARNGHEKCVEILLKASANKDVVTNFGYTALIEAAEMGHTGIVKRLLQAGANYQIKSRNSITALMAAIQNEHLEIVALLSELGENFLNIADFQGRTALTMAHINGSPTGITQADLAKKEFLKKVEKQVGSMEAILLMHGARKGWNEAELILASRSGTAGMTAKLINEGVNVNIADQNGCTPVWFAASSGNPACLQSLIEANANVNMPNQSRRTPLMEATMAGFQEIVQALLDNGAKVNERDENRDTALIHAARKNQTPIVAALLLAKADPFLWNDNVYTALMEASLHGYVQIVEMLLESGPREAQMKEKYVNFMDAQMRTALDLASVSLHTDCEDLLLKNGGKHGKEIGLIVYKTAQGRCYHFVKCSSIKEARERDELIPLSITEAIIRELDACSKCNPEAETPSSTTKILFLAADPTDATRLRLGKELSDIQQTLQIARLRDRISLEQRMSVQPDIISQALLDVNPQYVHFSGHGMMDGSLCFENETGEAQSVPPEALVALFEKFTDHIKCVVLNACYTDILAETLSDQIEYVIGMNTAIGDDAARAFSKGFYQGIGAGRSIEDAFDLGLVQIRMYRIPEHLTPVLMKKPALQPA